MYCESKSLSGSVDLKRGTRKRVGELSKKAYGLDPYLLSTSGNIAEELEEYCIKEESQELLLGTTPKKPIFLLRLWTNVLDLTNQTAMKMDISVQTGSLYTEESKQKEI